VRIEWLDRSLMQGPYLALVLSAQEFHKALDHCKIPMEDRGRWIKTDHSDATAHYLQNPEGQLVCIVAVRPKKDTTGVQIAAMLVHEAVHVYQQFRERIGEVNPSAEFEAYTIQSISQRLMQAYADRVGDKTK
jgi:hypothetical protein